MRVVPEAASFKHELCGVPLSTRTSVPDRDVNRPVAGVPWRSEHQGDRCADRGGTGRGCHEPEKHQRRRRLRSAHFG